jgi:hypothetical protein
VQHALLKPLGARPLASSSLLASLRTALAAAEAAPSTAAAAHDTSHAPSAPPAVRAAAGSSCARASAPTPTHPHAHALEEIVDQVAQQDAHVEHAHMVALSRVLLEEYAALKRRLGVADMADLARHLAHMAVKLFGEDADALLLSVGAPDGIGAAIDLDGHRRHQRASCSARLSRMASAAWDRASAASRPAASS